MNARYNLYNADCLQIMPFMENESIDLILTDPPYGTTACSWDSVIPIDDMWENLNRLIKNKSAIVLTATQPFASVLINSNIKMFKYDWVWNKTKRTDFIRAKLKPMGGHESVLVFSKSSVANGAKNNMDYFPQDLTKVDKIVKNGGGGVGFLGRDKENIGPNNKLHNPTYNQEFTGYPSTQLNFASVVKTVHPTQKPIELMEYLIKTYTREGGTILDFTMGSGTTGVACMKTNRKFIGIELNKEYFDIANTRISMASMGIY